MKKKIKPKKKLSSPKKKRRKLESPPAWTNTFWCDGTLGMEGKKR